MVTETRSDRRSHEDCRSKVIQPDRGFAFRSWVRSLQGIGAFDKPLWNAAGVLDLLIASATVVLGIYVAASTVGMVVATRSPLPFWDEWDELVSIRDVTWSWLISQHNEHRILIPRLVFWADRWLFGETYGVEFALNLVVPGLVVGLLVLISNARRPLNLLRFAWTFGLALAFVFWAVQWENFIWAIQIVSFLLVLFAVAAFTAMVLLPASLSSLCLVLLIETLATYTFANGILIAVLMVPLAVLLKRPHNHSIILTGGAFALLASYLYGYHLPPYHSSPLHAWQHLSRIALYCLAELGFPFANGLTLIPTTATGHFAIALGALGVVSLAAVTYLLVGHRRHRPCHLATSAIICFALGTTLLTGLGRAEAFGVLQAGSSRYATPILLFWYCLAILTLDVSSRAARLVIVAVTCAVIPVIVASQPRFAELAERTADAPHAAIPALLAAVDDTQLLENLYPNPTIIPPRAALLKAQHASIFADNWGYWLGTAIGEHVQIHQSGKCSGGFVLAEQVTQSPLTGWRAYGIAMDKSRKPIQRIILADRSGKIVGFAVNASGNRPVPDFMSGIIASGKGAWIGSFSTNVPDSIRAYALLDDHTACPLGPAKEIDPFPQVDLSRGPVPQLSTGGHIDGVQLGERTVITGWGMLSFDRKHQGVIVYTNLPVASLSLWHTGRPDVSRTLKDDDLGRSGIQVVITLKPSLPIPAEVKLCVETSDSKYGKHLLPMPSQRDLCPALRG